MPHVPAHNLLDVPVIIDGEGRTLGGGEWGSVDPDVYAVQAAVDAERLVIFPQGLPDGADPVILAAVGQDLPATPTGDDAKPDTASKRSR